MRRFIIFLKSINMMSKSIRDDKLHKKYSLEDLNGADNMQDLKADAKLIL
jgi:hypothetical protein